MIPPEPPRFRRQACASAPARRRHEEFRKKARFALAGRASFVLRFHQPVLPESCSAPKCGRNLPPLFSVSDVFLSISDNPILVHLVFGLCRKQGRPPQVGAAAPAKPFHAAPHRLSELPCVPGDAPCLPRSEATGGIWGEKSFSPAGCVAQPGVLRSSIRYKAS